MFSYLFTFRSQTAAQSGRRILYESGLRAQLRRAPPEISGLGCTWALYVGTPRSCCVRGTARSPARTGCTRTGIWRRRRCDLS